MKGWGEPILLGALFATAGLAACERDRRAPPPRNVELARVEAADVETIAGINGPDLAGRRVQLAGVPVQQVVSDRLLWIGPSAGQRVLVVLPDGQMNVQTGQRVNVTGTVERVPSAPDGLRRLDLPASGEDVLRIQVVYIQASPGGSAVQAE